MRVALELFSRRVFCSGQALRVGSIRHPLPDPRGAAGKRPRICYRGGISDPPPLRGGLDPPQSFLFLVHASHRDGCFSVDRGGRSFQGRGIRRLRPKILVRTRRTVPSLPDTMVAPAARRKRPQNKFVIDCSKPAQDQIMDMGTFETFLAERIKVGGKAGASSGPRHQARKRKRGREERKRPSEKTTDRLDLQHRIADERTVRNRDETPTNRAWDRSWKRTKATPGFRRRGSESLAMRRRSTGNRGFEWIATQLSNGEATFAGRTGFQCTRGTCERWWLWTCG